MKVTVSIFNFLAPEFQTGKFCPPLYNEFKCLVEKSNFCCKKEDRLTPRETFRIFLEKCSYQQQIQLYQNEIESVKPAIEKLVKANEFKETYGMNNNQQQ